MSVAGKFGNLPIINFNGSFWVRMICEHNPSKITAIKQFFMDRLVMFDYEVIGTDPTFTYKSDLITASEIYHGIRAIGVYAIQWNEMAIKEKNFFQATRPFDSNNKDNGI